MGDRKNIVDQFVEIGRDADGRLCINMDTSVIVGTDITWFGNVLAALAQAYTERLLVDGRGSETDRIPNEGDREQIEARLVTVFTQTLSNGDQRIKP